jgi:hypothetical protein
MRQNMIMNDEQVRTWKKAHMAYFMDYLSICLVMLRKIAHYSGYAIIQPRFESCTLRIQI